MNQPLNLTPNWTQLSNELEGELHTDQTFRMLYATDASVYRRLPLAVAIPRSEKDLSVLVRFANDHGIPLIPRAAGTSLAGQCVGEGLVVDMSVHFSKIYEINTSERWVHLQPGVIRDELNRILLPKGLFFGPNTSTASRCMIGGMVGNNSCGTTSIRYGTTRDKVREIHAILADGTPVVLGPKSQDEIRYILAKDDLEAGIYRLLIDRLGMPGWRKEIEKEFPKPSIHRRNTGYAVDVLLDYQPFNPSGKPLNLSKLIAGSEGTLCLITSVKIEVDPLPPPLEAVICAHFTSVIEAMHATVVAMTAKPFACELMDKAILDCTKGNIEQAENRFFVEGDPGAILAIEVRSDSQSGLEERVQLIIDLIKTSGFGYSFPVVYPPESAFVWSLRAAGLGVLSNMPGIAKPVAFVEDTAVALEDLPEYIAEFEALMAGFGQKAVYYAHAGAGELHLRPVLNLKTAAGQDQFHQIGLASAKLVKKYRGSLSGEHGDGRVRAEFIPLMIGEKNYGLLREIKAAWDPKGIFNPGKIVGAPSMKDDLRYKAGQHTFTWPTFQSFSEKGDMLQAAEACNGSGDCRKLHTTGATMCPSYQATRNEKDSTRGRANVLREVLTNPKNPANPLDSEEVHEVLDLCLSCKACKRECPSSVDMSALKSEAGYHYQRRNGVTRRAKFFGNFHKHAALASLVPVLSNAIIGIGPVQNLLKKRFGIANERSLPQFSRKASTSIRYNTSAAKADLILYIDEFTQYQDAHVAIAAARVLHRLGYNYHVIYAPSGRALISKAMLPEARRAAHQVLKLMQYAIEREIPVVGLEPSAILGFRDEYPNLVEKSLCDKARSLAQLALTFEEFLAREKDNGNLDMSQFTDKEKMIHLHLHCHQKALSHVKFSKAVLGIPTNYKVRVIPSGCCGMAGSFGYEAEHFELSQKIGELVLFPHLRMLEPDVIIAAAGTSCRHQIADGVNRKALHPAEILADALVEVSTLSA